MRNHTRRFGEQETAFRSSREDSAPTAFFDNCVEVLLSIETKQRQLKSSLSACFPMARSAVASKPREYRLQVVLKIDNCSIVSLNSRHTDYLDEYDSKRQYR